MGPCALAHFLVGKQLWSPRECPGRLIPHAVFPIIAGDLTVPTVALVSPVLHNLDPLSGRLLEKAESSNVVRVVHSDRLHLALVLQLDELRVCDMCEGRMEEKAVGVQISGVLLRVRLDLPCDAIIRFAWERIMWS